ncbi:tripartite tricarboxylate transporter TctB family protein [Corynebacterium suranareeae]|uniref:Tripartite tricarboxylate transporter TctB family protein n=1 Tax=Corynebacterium suranareeae TaxID=2506452 RepID=A0A161JPL7_9CORY|nr:tripartite tricarboxylate transporter TctB family protein [Corynebacterium suranareeae]BAU97421.1 tripartite tricarboxylate transporter TctB family protein [Corynebacterium suranareeae]
MTTNTQSRHILNGRGSLFVAAALGIFTLYIVYGIFTMDVPDSAQAPGPKLYPTLLAIASGVLTIALVIDTFRHPDNEPPHRYTAPVGETVGEALIPVKETDRKNLILALIAVLVFAFLLEPLGWIISAALLFWAIALCMGSGRPIFNMAVGLVVSSAIQVAFSMGLGLSLPAGILGGLF